MNDIAHTANSSLEALRISPENLLVAESYLKCNSVKGVAVALNMPVEEVAEILGKREVAKFIDAIYLDTGYRNREKLGTAIDSLIEAKLDEMKEAEITSSKDIADLLALAHKIRMEEMTLQLRVLEAERKARQVVAPGTVVNIQDNSEFGGNYGSLMTKLLGKD